MADTDTPIPSAGERGGLSEQELHVLAIAGRAYHHAGSLHSAVTTELGISVTRYHQILNRLITYPPALEHAPVTLRRLARLREARMHGAARRRLTAS